jgi:C3HC4-type zinc finger (RING finger) protein
VEGFIMQEDEDDYDDDDDDIAEEEVSVQPKCAVLVIVPRRSDRQNVISALKKPGSPDVAVVPIEGCRCSVSLFIGADGSMHGVIVLMQADKRARMNRLPKIAVVTTCSRLILVNPGYTQEDITQRRIGFPPGCGHVFVLDSATMGALLGLGREARERLYRVFGEERPAPPPRVEPIDIEVEDERREENSDEIVARAERDFAELERRESAPQIAAGFGSIHNSVIVLHGGGSGEFNRRDVQNFVSSRVNGGQPMPRRRGEAPARQLQLGTQGRHAAPAPAPAPRPQSLRGPSASEIAFARARERRQQTQLTNLVNDVVDNGGKKAEIMLKPREEDVGIAAMSIPASSNTCMICLSSHITAEALPCRHTNFCYACIKQWVDKADTCPVCRCKVTTVVQMITPIDVNTEAKKRARDPVHMLKVADELAAEADDLRKRAKKIQEEGGKKPAQ